MIESRERSKHPAMVVADSFVIIDDAYPKARCHSLAIARDPSLDGPANLSARHIPLLQQMKVALLACFAGHTSCHSGFLQTDLLSGHSKTSENRGAVWGTSCNLPHWAHHSDWEVRDVFDCGLMHQEGARMWVEGKRRNDPSLPPVRLGFHSLPSLRQLHLHIISQVSELCNLMNVMPLLVGQMVKVCYGILCIIHAGFQLSQPEDQEALELIHNGVFPVAEGGSGTVAREW